jgi:hypothetical protein
VLTEPVADVTAGRSRTGHKTERTRPRALRDLKARAEQGAGDITGETNPKVGVDEGAGDISGETNAKRN